MKNIRISDLLEHTTAYDRWRASMDPGLVREVGLAGLSIGIALVVLWAAPSFWELAQSPFFLILGKEFRLMLTVLIDGRTTLIILDMLCAVIFFFLLAFTRGFRAGRAFWHWIAFGEVGVGVANAGALGVGVAIVALNIVIWVSLLIAAAVGIVLILTALAALESRPGK